MARPGPLCTAEEHTGTPSPDMSRLANILLIKTNRAGGPTAVREDRANRAATAGDSMNLTAETEAKQTKLPDMSAARQRKARS